MIRDLAERHAMGRNVPERVLNLYRWFQTAFEYSLAPDTPAGMHPLEGFLFHTHKGHCEYFASAMALMLRARNIPSRIVTGYYTTEWNGDKKEFVARQSDAHAWCEIWLDGLGWLSVDPTPPIYRGSASLLSYEMPWLRQLRDRLRALWQNYILDYSNTTKAEYLTRLTRQPLIWHVENVSEWFRRVLINHLSDRSLARMDWFKWDRELPIPLLRNLLPIALLAVLWLAHRHHRRRRRGDAPAGSTVAFMNQLLSQLEGMGWRRRPGQTPTELVRQVERQSQGRWQLQPMLDLYHRCRFAGESPTAGELTWIQQTLRDLHP